MLSDAAYRLIRPALGLVEPETAHRLAIRALAAGLGGGPAPADDPVLSCRVWSRDLSNPLGLAAGFDKDGEAPDAVLRLGFGHVEIGSVTPLPQEGNPRPRLFRLEEDRAVLNRCGFNSGGLAPLVRRLEARRTPAPGLLGINLGKNKTTEDETSDFVLGIDTVCRFADYLVINVSSPNTPGLRDLQGRAAMRRIVTAALAARDRAAVAGREPPPLLVKLAPDLDDDGLRDAARVALETGLDGLILGNTTITRPAGLRSPHRAETGGLSGRPLFALSTAKLADLYRFTEGRLTLVGLGGVSCGRDAYAKVRAGASLVQLYSALVFEGPGLARRVTRELAALLRRDGFASVGEAVGADHR